MTHYKTEQYAYEIGHDDGRAKEYNNPYSPGTSLHDEYEMGYRSGLLDG